MDKNVDLFKAVANKLQRAIDEKKTSDTTSNNQRCLSLNRRSSDESEDHRSLRLSTSPQSSLGSARARNPSYPSTCSNSSPESPPNTPTTRTPNTPTTRTPNDPTARTPNDPTARTPNDPTARTPNDPTARTPNDPCNNWSDIRYRLDKITQTPPSTHASKLARKRTYKKRAKAKRINVASSSSPSSETVESRSASDKSPEPMMPLLELHDNVGDPANCKSQTRKRKRSQDGCPPLRKLRRFNSLDESSTPSNRSRCQVDKPVSPNSNRNISGFEIQKKKLFKRRHSLDENLQPCNRVSHKFFD